MATYEQISGTFWRSADGVFCEGRKIDLNPKTARVYFDTWATDGKRVYMWSFERRGIDAETFVPLNDLYAKDASACYARPKKIAGADPKHFEVLDSGLCKTSSVSSRNFAGGFARDQANVYHDGNRVPGADTQTFVSVGDSFGRDAKSVFYEHRKLQGADPRRWRVVAGLFSQDDKRVYYMNRPVPDADPGRFYALSPGWPHFAYDGVRFFCNGRVSSAEEYAENLERHQSSYAQYIELLRSGKWEQLRHAESWPYRSPAEREE